MDELIVSYKTVGKEFPAYVWNYRNERLPDNPVENAENVQKVLTDFSKFKNSSNKIINYMIKEFERKKAAKEYRRASVAKTGVLDINKLHSYQYNEDIFLKRPSCLTVRITGSSCYWIGLGRCVLICSRRFSNS